MIELIQITDDLAFARRCDALDGMRVFVDLERTGKAQRQAGRNTFISTHEMADVAKVKSQLRRSPLMVRVNPLHEATGAEVQQALDGGADLLMLPMFAGTDELRRFVDLVDGRAQVVALLETAGALSCAADWIGMPGLAEVYVGLNDLHLSLGRRFMFEPLAEGVVDTVATLARRHGTGFGFGGIARLDEGLLPGRDVLAEHVRLGSQSVILSRTFHRSEGQHRFEDEVAALRATEAELRLRTAQQAEGDRERIALAIRRVAAAMAVPA